jgi:hypothetical protein
MIAANRQLVPQDKEEAAQLEKLDDLAGPENPVLFTLTSIFPFDFSTTRIVIEKTKVDIIREYMFGTQRNKSILITDLSTVELDKSFLFATLIITSRLPGATPTVVQHLRKADADKAKNIIQGLMIGARQQVDISQVSAPNLVSRVEKIGAAKVAV